MALGYGYVRDDDPVQVNWSEISKNFTDRIKADQVDRQKRKDDIQEKFNDLQKDLINKPQGYNTDLNKVVGSFSGQASSASLDLLNKLKSGQITEQEYYTKRANLKSSTENFFLYSKNFNDNYGRLMELARSNDPNKKLSAESMFQLQIASDMLDFKNTTAIVDPGTNELILVKTDEDGNPTNEIVNVSQLGYLSSDEKLSYNYKNLISENLKNRGVKKYTDENGKVITTIQGVEVDTKTAEGALSGLAESIVGDQSQMISILAQNGYTFTKDPSKKDDPKTIYYDMNTNKYEFDTDAALSIVTDEINNSISVEVKDETTSFQKQSLANQDRAFDEGVRQFNETLALKQAELIAENNLSATDISSPTNFFRTTEGLDTTVNNYIRTINEDSFDTPQKQRDVIINLNEGFKTIKINDAKISFDDTEGEVVRESVTPPGPYSTGGTPAVYSFEKIIIDIPNVTDGPITIPVNSKTTEYLETVMNALGNAKKTNTTVKGSDFTFIVDNDFYNPGAPQEEEVVVEDEEVVVDPTKYNN
jgi:hypothetical protein